MANDGFDADGNVTIFGRIIIAVAELNMLIRVAAMGGESVQIDSADRTDPTTGGTYMELLVSSTREVDDDASGEAPA